ncbi:MAG TPA: response regulator, partial [Cyanobacteria bacterium UBA8543]|nr:response regulator [Cyanobacteria bacterium UBA8543]
MDDLEFSICCEQPFAGIIGGQRYGSTQPLILAVDDDE